MAFYDLKINFDAVKDLAFSSHNCRSDADRRFTATSMNHECESFDRMIIGRLLYVVSAVILEATAIEGTRPVVVKQ